MARALKIVGIVLGSILLVLVLLAGFLWWWSGTQHSLDWTLDRISRSQTMSVKGARGSLREGVRADYIQWEHEGLKVEASAAELAWQPLALIRGTIQLDRLHAARLRIENNRPPEPKKIPANLTLPLRVEIADLKIGQFQWVTREREVEAGDLAGNYAYNAITHKVKLTSLKWMGGTYSGEGSLNAGGTMDVDAKFQGRFAAPVPGAKASAPLSFTATIGGKLVDMQARAQLQGEPDSPMAGTSLQATARITPWADQPLPQVNAEFQRLDVGALWAQAPSTSLSGKLQVQPAGADAWSIGADVSNATPGPWDQGKLPVEQLSAAGEWRGEGAAVVRELRARAGGGTIAAKGEWRTAGEWAIAGELTNVDPGALYGQLAHLPVSGKANVRGEGNRIDFDVDLAASGKARDKTVAALELRTARAKGRWQGDTLSLPLLDVRVSDATVQASVVVQPKARTGSGSASVDAPGLQVRVDGKVAERSGGGTLDLRATDIAQALKWLARWPGVPADLGQQVTGGRADAQVSWQGGWADPAVQARIQAPQLTLAGAQPWNVRDATATVNGRLSDARLEVHGRAEQGQRRVNLDAVATAGRRGTAAKPLWQGQLDILAATVLDPAIGKGPWSLALQKPVGWRFAAGRFEAAAGTAIVRSPRANDPPALVAWGPVLWGGGELQSTGRISGLPLAWLEFFGGPQFAGSAISGDMVFDAQWDARLGASPQIRAVLTRAKGDVTVLAENAQGRSVRVPAGVRDARITIENNGEQVTATVRWDSEQGGTAEGRISTRLARGGDAGWQWPDNAPLDGELRAQLPRIGVWSLLAPTGWRLRGSLLANIKIGGTKADPQLTGTVSADDLALRSVVDGFEMQGGRLRARFDGKRVIIEEFLLRGGGPNGGTLTAKGEGVWTPAGPQAVMTAELNRLRASIRSDRQVTVSGTIAAKRDASGTVVNGNLRIDQALIVMADEGVPKLGDDVVVRNAAAPITRREARAAEEAQKKQQDKLQVAIDIDLGNDFRVQGMGVDTRLRGTVALTAQNLGQPRIVGTIRADGGEYRAYGQRLTIERGIIRFTGSPENPSLDILAIRPRLPQRVGVMVTGTVFAPFVRLYSEPDLPEAEKLAWLVTGRAAPATGAEAALVQQAALALLASRTRGGGQGIAAQLGLDELSFRRDGEGGGPSVRVGRRFGENFYAAYERGLSGAVGTLYIFYELTRKFTVRGQAGERTAVDVIYTFTFD